MHRDVVISGFKKSGKTSLIEGVVSELKSRGYRVGTIKHVPEEGFSVDKEGTDTWRFSKAGSDFVVSVSPDEVAYMEKDSVDVEELLLELDGLDFVILEGFKSMEKVARIVVAENKEDASKLSDDFTIGFVGQGTPGEMEFSLDDYDKIADLIEDKAVEPVGNLDCGDCGYESCRDFVIAAINDEAPKDGCVSLHGDVELSVDGKKVPLNSFVEKVFSKTIKGLVSSLEEDIEDKDVEIEVRGNGG